MRSIPNAVIAAPKDETELKDLLYMGLGITDGPLIIRYPRGTGEGTSWRTSNPSHIEAGKAEKLVDGSGIAILALCPCSNRAREAAERLREETGNCPMVYNVRFLKPLNQSMMEEVSKCRTIITMEEGALKGGLYSEVCEYVSGHGVEAIVKGFGVPDRFITQASASEQRTSCGLDTAGIYSEVLKLFKNN